MKIFKELNKSGIKYVLWKNFHEIDDFFLGKSDIDLFVDPEYRSALETVLKKFIIFKAEYYHSSYAGIEHYFWFCVENNRVYHLHVYFKLITGNTWMKEFELEIDCKDLDQNVRFIRGIRCISLELAQSIFCARSKMKSNGLFNQLVLRRDAKDHALEKCFLRMKDASCHESVNYSSRINSKALFFVFALKVFRKIVSATLFSNKRRLKGNGIIVAIGGPDGAGKSTVSEMLFNDLNSFVCTARLSPGRLAPNKVKKQNSSAKAQTRTKALRLVVVGIVRFCLCYWAVFLKRLNVVVLSDRWPGQVSGANDSPSIDPAISRVHKILAVYERLIYQAIPKCDLFIDLDVPLHMLKSRNAKRSKVGKETDLEIEVRAKIYSFFSPKATCVERVDGTVSREHLKVLCLREISKALN